MPSADRIVLELEQGVSPIAGRVLVDVLPPRPFSGWTELFGVLRDVAADLPLPSKALQED